jgi:hypothetical protein
MFERAKLGRYIRLEGQRDGFFGNFIFVISKIGPLSIFAFGNSKMLKKASLACIFRKSVYFCAHFKRT